MMTPAADTTADGADSASDLEKGTALPHYKAISGPAFGRFDSAGSL